MSPEVEFSCLTHAVEQGKVCRRKTSDYTSLQAIAVVLVITYVLQYMTIII